MNENNKMRLLYERLILGRKERVTMSILPIETIQDKTNQLKTSDKPTGLWYGFGDNWINFVKNDFPVDDFSKHKYGYKVYVDNSKILSLIDDEDLDNFIWRYQEEIGHSQDGYSSWEQFGKSINWQKVSRNYSGIEMPRYQELGWRTLHHKHKKYLFLYSWDVDSGCIWRPDGILKIKPL